MSYSRKMDLEGEKFGRLTVLEYEGVVKNRGARWRVRCECGNEKVVDQYSLRKGTTKSCGCLVAEHNRLPTGQAHGNHVYRAYKAGAKKRNLEFDLIKEEFFNLTSQVCIYCGAEPKEHATMNKGNHDKSYNGVFVGNGIDRLDSSLGYIAGNLVPCCWICNSLKARTGRGEFLAHVIRIAIHQAKTNPFFRKELTNAA